MRAFFAGLLRSEGSLKVGPWNLSWSFVRYLCVGVINTLLGLSVIYFGIYVLRLDDVSANLIGYLVGALCSFGLNRSWTFSNHSAPMIQFAKFLAVMVGAYLLNILSVVVMIKFMGFNRYLSHAIGTAPYTLAGYFGNRYFTFRDSPIQPTSRL